MRTLNVFFLLVWSTVVTFSALAQTKKYPPGVRPEKIPVFQRIIGHMDVGNYDSAEVVIINQLLDQDNRLTKQEQYYLLGFEAEIMYYNALFDIGLSSAHKALEISYELNNDTLIGSALNLEGLQHMHLRQYPEAKSSFKEAISLLPPKTDKSFYSQRYHALANLAEVYLYQQMPDSAIFYSKLAVNEALLQGVTRGASFSYWSIAEGELLRKNIGEARKAALQGLDLLKKTDVADAKLFLSLTMMKVYTHTGENDSLAFYQNIAETYLRNTETSDFAKLAYLEFLIDFGISQGNPDKALANVKRYKDYQNKLLQRQEKQRNLLLSNFYRGKEQLLRAELRNEAQERQLTLRNALNIILLSFILLAAIFVFVGYRNLKHRQQINILKVENETKDEQQKMRFQALKQRMEAINQERNRIASDLHDEIGAALSSIHIYSTVALQLKATEQSRLDLMKKIKTASEGLLDRMSDIIWSINPENERLRDLKLRVKNFAADLLYPLNMAVSYNFNEADDEMMLSVLARKNLYLTFKEVLNNTAKYSRATRVEICLKIEGDQLKCSMKDNGQGFNPLTIMPGNGLGNMQRRIKDLGGELTYTTAPGEGVAVTYYVPVANISD